MQFKVGIIRRLKYLIMLLLLLSYSDHRIRSEIVIKANISKIIYDYFIHRQETTCY